MVGVLLPEMRTEVPRVKPWPRLTVEAYGGPFDGDRLTVLLERPDKKNMTVTAQREFLIPLPVKNLVADAETTPDMVAHLSRARYRLNRPISFAVDWLDGQTAKEIQLEKLRAAIGKHRVDARARSLRLDFVGCE